MAHPVKFFDKIYEDEDDNNEDENNEDYNDYNDMFTPSSSLTSISLSSTPYKQITIAPARVTHQMMNLKCI